MFRLTVVIFAVSTASVAFLNLAESAGEPTLHKDIPDDHLEEVNESADRSNAMAQGTATSNANRHRPLAMPSSPRPGPMSFDVVECYVCTDCPKINDNTTSKLCPHTLDVTRQNKCVTYAEQYKHMKRPWYIRGCASERGACDDIRKAHSSHMDIVSLLSCNECVGEKCNTSDGHRSLADMTLALFTVVVTPIMAKYMLS